jgi:hypothetical protein
MRKPLTLPHAIRHNFSNKKENLKPLEQEGEFVVMVQEYADGGDLFSLLQKYGGRLHERAAVSLVLEPFLRALQVRGSCRCRQLQVQLLGLRLPGLKWIIKEAGWG